MKTNPVLTKPDKTIGRDLANSLFRQFLEEGIVDPSNKTDEQVTKELFEHARAWVKQKPVMMSIDHKSSLLKQARFFAKQRAFEEAFLFYATWFEHWINGVLTRRLHSIDDKQRRQMLSETKLGPKYTWLLSIIHGAKIPSSHISTVLHVAKIRNGFVHHKFILSDVDKWKEEDKQHIANLAKAEMTVRYLKRFEQKLFLTTRAKELVKKLKAT